MKRLLPFLLVMMLVMGVVLPSVKVSYAQDGDGTTQDESDTTNADNLDETDAPDDAPFLSEQNPDQSQPSDVGTPGLVEALDDLNLPAVPPSPNATAPDSAPAATAPPILPDMECTCGATNETRSYISLQPVKQAVVATYPNGRRSFLSLQTVEKAVGADLLTGISRGTHNKLLLRQSSDLIASYTNPTTGNTVNVLSDSSFVVEDEGGSTLISGFLGSVGADVLVALGAAQDGTRYAFHGDYYSAYTTDGDLVIGNTFTSYHYDFDEEGTLLSLSDSAGGDYQVEPDNSGRMSITGPDDYEFFADDAGAFEMYDDSGDLLVEGDLYDEGNDEFADFEATYDDNFVDIGINADDSTSDEGFVDIGINADDGTYDDEFANDDSVDDGTYDNSVDDGTSGDEFASDSVDDSTYDEFASDDNANYDNSGDVGDTGDGGDLSDN